MDNQAWARVTAEFERQRQNNEQEEARRRQEIARKLPALDQLMEERHSMILRAVRGAFADPAMRDAEAMMEGYNKKINAALTAAGYPADYLAPVCRCPVCRDEGYVYENAVRKPCACFMRAYNEMLSEAGQSAQGAETFSAFDENRFPDAPLPGTDVTQREYMRVVRDRCRQYAANVPNGNMKTLLLHGGSGLGKTFLLNCVGNDAKERGVDTLYVTAYDLLMALKNAYFSRTGETAQEYFDAQLLLIDDLGMEPLMENITVEQFYHLFNARLTKGLYTTVSTNLNREEIKNRYTERVSSRLLDTRTGMAIPFKGKDIRLMK
ncbi:MAG: DnaA/Hda family protein [Clostridia bacterium]|nr:DnaA/Hda family protein [Clostridia bacterium]